MSAAPPEAAPGGLPGGITVSRETRTRLERHLELLRQWQKRINLVGPATLADAWQRHTLDSAQLFALLPATTRRLVDLGSGAGFPGLVLAILGVPEVHLVEADRRKAAFLREAARLTGTDNVVVHARRIEELAPFPADVVTARALAPLPRLLALAAPFLGPGGVAIFPKGREVAAELTAAAQHWTMQVEQVASATAPGARILLVREVQRVEPR